MKTSTKKSSTTTSKTATQVSNQPFFTKAGGGDFFAPARQAAVPAVQLKMAVSKPGDKLEQEADKMADNVMRMPTPAPIAGKEEKLQRQPEEKLQKKEEDKIQKAAMPEEKIQKAPATEEKLQRKSSDDAPSVDITLQSAIQSEASGGQPLSSDVRSSMESRFGADFSNVRIHNDTESAILSNQLKARAFTYRNHIFFAPDQYQPGTSEGKQLIAHELTHTLQQGAGVQRSNNGDSLIQREEKKSSWFDDLIDFGETAGSKLLQEFAPALVPIVRKGPEGIFDWLKERAGAAVEGVFNSLMAPVRAITGVGQQLSAQFAPILATIQEAGGKIARNDCSPLREAAEKIEKTAERLITPIVEKLQPVVAKVKDFFNFLWDKIGGPIWEWIKQYAADKWAEIQFIAGLIQTAAKWIWDKTASIRALADKAWTWFKNKLGIGEGVEGQDGLLQWVQRKLEAAWAVLKVKLEPFKSQLTTVGIAVGAVALAISPAGPLLAIGAAVAGAVQGLRWIYNNWGKGDLVVKARVYLEKTLIPPLQGAVKSLSNAVTRMADSITGALASFAAGMARAVGSLGGSLLTFAVSAVQWIADQVTALADWAKEKLGQLSQWLGGALGKLEIFLRQMLQFFAKVGGVVLDIWGLPILLVGELWGKVPACIRTPIEDFLGQLILKQIELFQELVKDNVAWQKTKADVGKIINLVFKDHNLIGAIKVTFFLILRVFNLPPDMLVTVARKAASAWDTISKKPLDFIKNTVRSLGHGFRLLWANIGTHLQFGLEGWLLGEIKDKNIKLPESWTNPKDLFWFVMDVLGLTVNHIWELLAQRFPPEKVQKVRDWFGKIAGALEWVNKAIDTSKTPAENSKGLVNQAKEFGTTILTGIADWVAGKVAEELAILAAGAAASGGLSEVLDVARRIYKAMVTAQRWARKILDMANETLDNIAAIASGAVEMVGGTFEKIMHKGMPVVIGFLADQVGLGGVGKALRETIDKLRKNVDDAILWLIDKVKAGIEALIGAVKAGVQAILGWWRATTTFKAADGETHTLLFKGEETNAVLTVKSTEMPYSEFINRAQTGTDAIKVNAKQEATRIAGLIDKERTTPPAGNTPDALDKSRAAKATRVNKLLEDLKTYTSILFGPTIPNSFSGNVNSGINSAGFGVSMLVKPLTNKNRPVGSPPTSANNPKYAELNERRYSPGGSSYYVKGHLLNQQLGGTGEWANLTPLSREGNAQHEVQGESLVKRTVDLPAIVEFFVKPNYSARGDKGTLLARIGTSQESADAKRVKSAIVVAEDWVPTYLKIEAYILDEALQRKNTVINQQIQNPLDRNYESYHLLSSQIPVPVNLSTDDAIKIATLPGIGQVLAERIVKVREERRSRKIYRFSSYEQISELVPGIGASRLKTLESAGHVRLY